MKRVVALAAIALVCAAPACADTFYTFAPVQGSVFAIDPGSIVVNGGVKSTTIYFVHPTRTAQAFEIEFDCPQGVVTTKSRKIVRTDLSLLRNANVQTPQEKPDPKTTIGIAMKLVCDWPKPPGKATQFEAEGVAAFLAQVSDRLRETARGTPDIVIDQTSVGNCIFGKAPKPVSLNALTLVQQGKSLGGDPQVRAEVEKAATACGVAPRNMDAAVFAALGVYGRYGIISLIPDKGKLREDVLAAAWNGADARAREPFLSAASLALTPGSTVDDVTQGRDGMIEAGKLLAANPELGAAIAKASSRNADQIAVLLRQYFVATAMGEIAEAKLAPQ